MNTEDKKIDQLTRSLMEESLEQPSSSLNSRIMVLIRREKHTKSVYVFRKMPSIRNLFAGLVIYLLTIISLSSFLQFNGAVAIGFIQMIKSIFPLILTVGSGISFYFFYGQLDNWLRKKEEE